MEILPSKFCEGLKNFELSVKDQVDPFYQIKIRAIPTLSIDSIFKDPLYYYINHGCFPWQVKDGEIIFMGLLEKAFYQKLVMQKKKDMGLQIETITNDLYPCVSRLSRIRLNSFGNDTFINLKDANLFIIGIINLDTNTVLTGHTHTEIIQIFGDAEYDDQIEIGILTLNRSIDENTNLYKTFLQCESFISVK